MRSHKTFVRCGCVAAMSALLLTSGCSPSKPDAPAPQAPEVAVATVHRQAVPVTAELPGRTSAYLVAQVRARVDGIVLKREFKEGSDVRANQRLYQVDPAPYRAALDSAAATLENAQANVVAATALAERDKVLIKGNAISKQELDNAIAAQGQAVASVASRTSSRPRPSCARKTRTSARRGQRSSPASR